MFIDVGVTATVGVGFTITVIVCVELQLPFEPVMVYVVVTVGLAVTTLPVVALNPEDGDHAYVVAPLAVNVVEPPLHIVLPGEAVATTVGVDAVETTIICEVVLHPDALHACNDTLYDPGVL